VKAIGVIDHEGRHRGEGDDPERPSRPDDPDQEAPCDRKRGRTAAEARLSDKAPKTVTNVLTVLNTLLKKALE
jgi:hypothetical protein